MNLIDYLDNIEDNLSSNNIDYDKDLFDNLRGLINKFNVSKTEKQRQMAYLNQINNQIRGLKKDLTRKSEKAKEDSRTLKQQYNKKISQKVQLNKNNEYLSRINDNLKKDHASYKKFSISKKEELYNLYQRKQEYMEIINNLSLLNDMIISSNIYDIDSFNLQSNIKETPAYILIKESGLFDEKYYKDRYLRSDNSNDELDDTIHDIDALEHYLLIGSKVNNNPNENFDSTWYKSTYLIDKDINPLVDYILNGDDRLCHREFDMDEEIVNSQEYRLIEESGLFDEEYYTKEYEINNQNPLIHYIREGSARKYRPYAEFDVEWYENQYNIEDENPLVDYILNYTSHDDRALELFQKSEIPSVCETYPYTFIKEYDLINKEEYSNHQNMGHYTDEIENYVELGYKNDYYLNDEFDKEEYSQSEENIFEDPLFNYITQKAQKSYKYDNDDYGHVPPLDIKDSIEYHVIEEEKVFDEKYYKRTNNIEDEDPLAHFILNESNNPSEYFDVESYRKTHPNLDINPLFNYVLNNKKELLVDEDVGVFDIKQSQEYVLIEESGLFDKEYYMSDDLIENDVDAIEHYLCYGWRENRNPNKDFDNQYYISSTEYLRENDENPLVYYILKGRENHDITKKLDVNSKYLLDKDYTDTYSILRNSRYFDSNYYIEHNPNLDYGDDAIDYYIRKGRYEDYPTSRYFDKKEYYKLNLDLKTYNIDPVVHYTTSGHKEKRPFKRAKLELEDLSVYGDDVVSYYNTIYDSEYFDEYYYIEHNSDVEEMDIDPILHYILVGADNGKNPSAFFSTDEYLKAYGDVKNNGVNPLYHYLQSGKREGRNCYIPKDEFVTDYESKYDLLKSREIFDALHKRYTIIIPIYNAYEETRECIRSVLLNTSLDYELILINDCSSDERIDELLESLENINNIRIINNEVNMGFVKNVNMGMKLSSNDVILLNSDTIVTPKWLSKIVISAYTNRKVGTVTPLSNSSDISISELGVDKTQHALNDMAYQVDKLSHYDYLEAPTGNGFCLFIKRQLIEEIGLFDEVFGMGYGEETDFTQRAYKKGWINLRNTSVFVYHRRHASFKKENTDKLKLNNRKIIEKRHPDVFRNWDKFVESVEVQKSLDNIRNNIQVNHNMHRILCVVEKFNQKTDFDLLMYLRLSRNYDTYLLSIEEDCIRLYKYTPDICPLLNEWKIDYSWDEDKFFRLYFNLLVNLKIDLLYIKQARRLYHPTNRLATSYTSILKYLEIDMIHEMKLTEDNILSIVDERLNPDDSLDKLIEHEKSRIDFSKKRCVVYTAVTGTYDEPIIPSYVNDDFDYICFTDNPFLKSDFWQIRQLESEDLDSVRSARMYKILPHKYLSDYDYSLWIDTNIEITGDIADYINKYSTNKKLLCITHELRDCIYDEADACISMKKDSEDTIIRQKMAYKDESYPHHNGLIASGVLFRNHHDGDVIRVMEDWFTQVCNHSYRDQLSFNYACWKNNYEYEESPIYYEKSVYFQRHDHLNEGYFTRKIDTPFDSWYHLKYKLKDTNNILNSFNTKTSIVVPIYNAYEETRRCIESVLEYTTIDYELVLINDCSSDERIRELLDSYEDYPNIRVYHNEKNQGFVKNVNKAFMLTSNDVILLNSDTRVSPKWLQKLKIKAYSHDDIATVTPVSNSAGAFSVPHSGENNINPDDFYDLANIVEKTSDDSIILTPTGNGFCMYIKRDAIDSVGFFDEIYGRGYGEENDFCMRLNNKGWKHIIDPSTYIYHERSASFSTEKEELIKKNSQTLRSKFPEYKMLVNEFTSSSRFHNIRLKIDDAINSTKSESNRKSILYAIHNGSGGTLHTSIELMKNIDRSMDAYLLVTGNTGISLYKYNSLGNNDTEHKDGDKEFVKYLQLLRSWPKEYVYSAMDDAIDELRVIYFNLLVSLKIDIVHIRHLIYSSFDLPQIAKTLGIPVILSFHDFYYICPSHNLLDDEDKYCAGICSPYNPDNEKNGQCNITAGLNIPLAKTIITPWRNMVDRLLDYCDAYVTTCQSAYDLYTHFYPKLKDRDFNIIEHGRNLETPKDTRYVTRIDPNKKVKIVFPGHIGKSKGSQLIKDIKKYDVEDRLEFHFMGSILGNEDLEDIGTYHGFYDRSEFNSIIHEIKPHFIALLSIWPETYCHTLTEGWASGIPILTIDIGALGERVKTHGGGFFIDTNPQKAYEEIIDISKDGDYYMKVAEDIPKIRFKSSESMGDDYLRIYEKYIK